MAAAADELFRLTVISWQKMAKTLQMFLLYALSST